MAETVDSIIAELIVRGTDQYERSMKRIADAHDAVFRSGARLADDKSLEVYAARQTKAAAQAEAASNRRAAAEKRSAKAAEDAASAETRAKAAAEKASAQEAARAQAAADKKVAAAKRAADAVTAAAAQEAAAHERLAAVVDRAAERAQARQSGTQRGASSIGRMTIPEPSGQRSIPTSYLNATGSNVEAAIEKEINHALIDRASLQAGLTVATRAEGEVIREQLIALRLVEQYKRGGLTETQAAIKAEETLLQIEGARVRKAAELAATQAATVEKQMRAQSTKTAGAISAIAPTLVGGITVHEISALNDEYIKLTNTLRVAGVSTAEFGQVQDHLLATANRTGTDINALADVYRGAALASKDLGASQDNLLKITDAAANSLRISGRSSEEARGALLQLGHAFESGRVTAREFNSLALNAYPILQAVAKGSDEYGGSVAKLRDALLQGDITSKVFFQDLLKGSDDLEKRAGAATLTTAQGFNALKNSLIVYFGEADKSQGVSAALGFALQKLAENLDSLIPAITAVATALTVGYTVRLATAAAATENLGGAILAAFGGPVGIAITAVTLAIGAFAVEANNASLIVAQANASYAELQDRLKVAATQAVSAAGGVKGVGNDALGAIPKVNAFAGAVGNLAQQLYNQARAARAARVESLTKQLQDSQSREVALGDMTPGGRRSSLDDMRRGDLLKNGGILGKYYTGGLRSLLSGGRTDREAQDAYAKQVAVSLDLQRQIAAAKVGPITASDIPGGSPVGSNPNAARITKLQGQVADLEKLKASASGRELATINKAISKREKQIGFLEQGVSNAAAVAASAGGSGRAGPSAQTLAKREEAARLKGLHNSESYNTELKQAHDRELQAAADLSGDAVKRADLERQRVRDAAVETAKNIRNEGPKDKRLNAGVAGTGERSAAEVDTLLGINTRTADLNIAKIDQAERARLAQESLALDRADIENRRDQLQSQSDLADTVDKRRKLALQILDLDYQLKERELKATLAPDSGASANERKIAQGSLDALPSLKAGDERRAIAQNQGAGAAFVDSLKLDRPQFIQSEEVKTLQAFNSELDDSISKALHLHGVFGSIIGDLIDMAIKQALIKPIANSLFGGGSGGQGGGGFLGSILGAIGLGGGGGGGISPGSLAESSAFSFTDPATLLAGIPGFATGGGGIIGGNGGVDRNLLSLNGKPVAKVGRGEMLSVTPANLGAVNQRVSAPSQSPTLIQQTIHVDASNSVNPDGFEKRILAKSAQVAVELDRHASRQTLDATPGYLSRTQNLKG